MADPFSVFLTVWFLNPSAANPALPDSLRRVLPGVHAVREKDGVREVETAGISVDSFGALQANTYDPPSRPRTRIFRMPSVPVRSANPTYAPLGVIGVLVNGMPIYNPISTVTYNGQGIWHRDAVRDDGSQGNLLSMASIIGYALDGFPIYGSIAPAPIQSSYRLRSITQRVSLPDGTRLTPGQYGPAVSDADPLGTFVEDYEYVPGSGDLDEYNGRFAATPEFPQGAYAYYLTSAYPHLIGPRFAGVPLPTQLKQLSFAAIGPDGRKQRFPEIIHEKPLHLILISDDMTNFQHVHPELGTGDEFEITAIYPGPGRYHAYAQSTPAGGANHVEHRILDIPQASPQAAPLPPKITVELAGPRLETGKDLSFRFRLQDAKTGQPVHDLDTYLGEWGHFIAISYDKATFLHVHPATLGIHDHTAPMGSSPSEIEVVAGFDRPGKYRMWAQFKRAGVEMSFPFDLEVAAGAPIKRQPATPTVPLITVSPEGYTPAELTLAGAAKIAFRREGNTNCGSRVVFPDLGIERSLPAGEIVEITLPQLKTGTYRFTCGMGMYRGAIVSK